MFNSLRRIRKPMAVSIGSAVVLLALLGVIAGCEGGGEGEEPTAVVELTPVPVSSPGATEAPSTETPTPVLSEPAPTLQAETGESGMADLLYRLSQGRISNPGNITALTALREIAASGDWTYIAALTDLIQVPLTRNELLYNVEQVIPVMQQLSGQSFEYDGKAWVEWLAQQPDLQLPEGYFRWKVDLLSDIDPAFRSYFTTGSGGELIDPAKIDLDLRFLVWGGVLQDDGSSRSIPSLVEPAMVEAAEATYLESTDRVFGVAINGDARAYPLRIMNWHEMANDVVGGVPVALAYCTLCGSGILYDTDVDGDKYVFRSSGLLYFSNKLMYDLTTGGLWNQFTGVPVTGSLVDSDIRLNIRPVTLTTWGDWLATHPDTLALDINTGYPRNYSSEGQPGAAYTEYYGSPDLWFPVGEYDERLLAKAVVYGVEIEGEAKAYPVEMVGMEALVNDEVGGKGLVLLGNLGTKTVLAFERMDARFVSLLGEEGETTLVDENGVEWRVGDEKLEALDGSGQELSRVPGRTSFWFAWRAFFPETGLYGSGGYGG